MKSNDELILKLEQLYYTSINDIRASNNGAYPDVPNIVDNQEYKTNVPMPGISEEIEDPEIKTKKGKNVLREPPPNPEDNKIEDIEMFDKKGNEIENWENDLEDLDRSEEEEKIQDLDDDIIIEEAKEEIPKIEEEKAPKAKKEKVPKEEDNNGMSDIANTNMAEQNPESGVDPNIDPNQVQPDPSGLMGGTDPNIDPMTGEQKLTADQVGKIFELKKIYSRLLAIESQLSFSADIVLVKLRKFITQSIELFETVISNIDAFRENIDKIIVLYYEFLEEIYDIMKRYYKIKQREEEEKGKGNKVKKIKNKK
jgi:hypothetical protein